jgi:hypothetical protein
MGTKGRYNYNKIVEFMIIPVAIKPITEYIQVEV